MAENSKYYTPKIEEFHVGFEFESNYVLFQYGNKGDDWCKYTLKKDKYWFWDAYHYDAVETEFRVKYLDKEDIESFGFKHIGSMWFEIEPSGELGHWTRVTLRKWKGDKSIITGWRGDEQGVLFSGDIRNKSELKRILNQIKVKIAI